MASEIWNLITKRIGKGMVRENKRKRELTCFHTLMVEAKIPLHHLTVLISNLLTVFLMF